MIVFVVARTVPIISSNNGRQRSHIVGHVCLIFATIASSLLLAARSAMQLFQSAANCSFPLLFLQSAFLLTTWPTNRLQIERKPATSYAPALPSAASSSLPSLPATPCRLARSTGPAYLQSPAASEALFHVHGSDRFSIFCCSGAAALLSLRFRFTFYALRSLFDPRTGPGAELRSCAQFFLCFAV